MTAPESRPMRIVFIINDLSGGGAERALLQLAGFLVGEGHEVKLLTLHSDADAYPLDTRIERVTLRTGVLARGLGKVLALPLHAAEIARWLATWAPDISVSFLPRANVSHVLTQAFGNRRPIAVTEQVSSRDAYPSDRPADRVMRRLIRRFYPLADAVFPSSAGVLEGLVTFGVQRERMHVVHNAFDVAAIARRADETAEGFPAGDLPTVITVGRHADQKDHETLIRAFSQMRRRVPARLVFVGQGPLRESLGALARDLGVEDTVVFAGWQSNPFAWLARADLFVLSSTYEGFGNVVVEAMACGLPVVSTDCPSGPAEILQGGYDGILVPVGEVDALAEAMAAVLTDEALQTRLAERARLRAPDFDLSSIGPRYVSLLQAYTPQGS